MTHQPLWPFCVVLQRKGEKRIEELEDERGKTEIGMDEGKNRNTNMPHFSHPLQVQQAL